MSQIDSYRLVVLVKALSLEMKGMNCRGPSAYRRLQEMGYKGTRQQVHNLAKADIDKVLTPAC
jgi:hypothetical protein